MTIRVALKHTTAYHYDRPVLLQPHIVRLRPAPHCRTPIPSYSLRIEPTPHFLNWQQDASSNYLARLVFPNPTRRFEVHVELIAELSAVNPFDFFLEPAVERFPFDYDSSLLPELAPYQAIGPDTPRLMDLVESLRQDGVTTIDFLVAINRRVSELVRYLIRMEPGVQTPEDTLTRGSGSCRDSSWLLVQLFRRLGLAARFVSGYLIQLTADIKSLDGPSGPESDFTDLHAWVEVYIPGAGWIGFDPTSGLAAAEGHIPLACAADPTNAAPISGSYTWTSTGNEDRCQETFDFQMSIQRVYEAPRVTLPYTEQQWETIDALGEQIDRDLELSDVRLTMGGEPTFVSIDDRDAAEWNFDALGPRKQRSGDSVLRRLRDRFAPGGLLHHGQGKWYPGEQLPRWSYGCYWRKDGVSLWRNAQWIAEPGREYPFSSDDAGRFLKRLAERIGVDPSLCQPAFEDLIYLLWRERRLPADVSPQDNRLDDPLERSRLARAFEQGLGRVVGYTLPLRRTVDQKWEACRWRIRSDQLFLIPGDSAMGYRLPLDLLAWPITDAIRSVLCVEVRDGQMRVFLPPIVDLEGFCALVENVETVAAELGIPILLEGYKPPSDSRLNHFQITPDPGVLEVNVHPAFNWRELVGNTTAIYEEARMCRLSAEKFMLDGRHTGTGGGNHLVIGGPTLEDSPILRRPDLLRSLLGFWSNHPALSYLFSSLFIGPTSQAPRVDEARDDSLHELELAFTQIPDYGGCPYWLVDRVFRHILIDVTGNTHRAEFCIDKLYSPDGNDGRRGLLELRGFEMPPHARMSLVQQLLVRAFIAAFWRKPYRQPLVRWGPRLHDRFMLEHYIEQDLRSVLLELEQSGYRFDPSWFTPHLEFRFPLIGSVVYHGVEIELRQAIEKWHVLGEEATGAGTARFVDSSVERLQVKVRGFIENRYVVTCNGRSVPLQPTGTEGEFVAGVRYRAWRPPSCLHPNIPIHAPLVFDLFDTWSGQSVGGCQYHVAHPGGRSYETFPVNAGEAEGRRRSRFFAFGHSSGLRTFDLTVPTPEAPLTLDLRQPLTGWISPPGRSSVVSR
ncbi:MAG: transglutaminase family protein [Planctomycetia bacterium]|nr:transglutaminase family protein [Planctomycetia bacterium]